jgi:hypothetical protein
MACDPSAQKCKPTQHNTTVVAFAERGSYRLSTRLFGPLRQYSGGHHFYSNEEMEVSIHEWLHMQSKIFIVLEILNLFQGRINASMCSGIVLKRINTSVE